MAPVFLQTLMAQQGIVLRLTFPIIADKLHSLPVKETRLDLELRRSLEPVLDYVFRPGGTTNDWHMLWLLLLNFQKSFAALYKRQFSFLEGIYIMETRFQI